MARHPEANLMRTFMQKLLRALSWGRSSAAERRLMENLEALLTLTETHMSKLSDFLDAQKARNLEVSDDLQTVKSLTGNLLQQVADLKTQLSASGNLSETDSAAMDALTASGNDLVAKADALAGKTPPTQPAAEDVAQSDTAETAPAADAPVSEPAAQAETADAPGA